MIWNLPSYPWESIQKKEYSMNVYTEIKLKNKKKKLRSFMKNVMKKKLKNTTIYTLQNKK